MGNERTEGVVGNLDALAFGMAKRVEHAGCGHGSIVLTNLGVRSAASLTNGMNKNPSGDGG